MPKEEPPSNRVSEQANEEAKISITPDDAYKDLNFGAELQRADDDLNSETQSGSSGLLLEHQQALLENLGKPDENTEAGLKTLERDRLEAEVETLKQNNQTLKDNNEARKCYAHRIFCLVAIWLTVVMIFFAFQYLCPKWEKTVKTTQDVTEITESYKWGGIVPDAVAIALIGSSSVNVIGLFVIVLNYLFFREKKAAETAKAAKGNLKPVSKKKSNSED